ncbi:putative mitochondrial actin-like protein [Leptomonas pyrrhocoris]|uniref:Putative mitochondrial actin-like protein n=1 Tax=Leptomonas pyrrhocoris TaxID=157538 RepID=A0A0M9FXH6_LEPPY|nr:putative mitochondrial actin-like protein [Leptomonas pyrrhocoris]XP_015656570.1 putative mitochondrial actin-like protein [Leptomonas pyrrhocoris]XP_015656571.1 putative mitochondrial actin-like protein [Leptomonas pyrrhocoris]XP_015656572.1 putative mitochondrial actin-like protein [Leptomonas pyrrhocoris]KPA78130.1 putative mitochondrial actin-like protein [Leptomonas pyrrhocoris]KPA78131.1 putative mitochondrial actin-like protein [Leptomonas pyrrhocoris]KPA78132.1 putative mitochondri|eukprot:XP_015656569.1 putative mitochondrial actin-like protein [Leptomonas pyrrhocoris]
MPNCVGAAPHAGTGIVGDQLSRLPHYHGLMVRRPVDRGFIVDGALQTRMWEHVLQHFAIEQEDEVDVWLTVPFAAPKAVAQLLWLLCTRSFRFGSVTVVSSSFLALVGYSFPNMGSAVHIKMNTAAGDAVAGERTSFPEDAQRSRKRARTTGHAAANAYGAGDGNGMEKGGTAIVVDVGFSGTTIVPYIDFLPVASSIIRLDVGGKLLTNRLKELLSFRQVNVMEDTWLINHVRERCCVTAMQPWRSLRLCAAMWEGTSREELEAQLTRASHTVRDSRDGSSLLQTMARSRGAVRGDESGGRGGRGVTDREAADTPVRFYLPTIPALLPLGVVEAELPARLPKSSAVDSTALQHLLLCQERFLIPELLFTPGDVGLDQQGLPQAITEGVFQRGLLQHVVTLLRPQLLKRVCVYGGLADTPLLLARLHDEVQAVAPLAAGRAGRQNNGSSSEEEDVAKEGDDVDGQHKGGVEAPPPLSALLEDAIAAAAADSNGASSVPSFSAMTLQPLIGAFCLLSADAASTSAAAQRLVRLRAMVQQRSQVELQRPGGGRVTVETFHEAMQRVW